LLAASDLALAGVAGLGIGIGLVVAAVAVRLVGRYLARPPD
jgi:hypothetical protein